jgi:hypothetical protein
MKTRNSPNLTPIKPLPFSPSQFLNSPTMNMNFDVNIPASTPVRKSDSIKVIFFSEYHKQKFQIFDVCFWVYGRQ